MSHGFLRRWLGTLAFVAIAGVGALFAQAAILQTTTGISYVREFAATDFTLRLATVNTSAATGSDCDAAGETGRLYWDSTNDNLEICSGASGWVTTGSAAAATTVDTLTLDVANADVVISRGGTGIFTFASTGNTNNEDLDLDLETTANEATFSSSTGVTALDFGALALRFDNTAGSVSLPSLCWEDAGGVCDTGFFQINTNAINVVTSGQTDYQFRTDRFVITQGNALAFDTASGTGDALIEIDASSVLKLGSGDNLFVPDSIITAGSGTGVTVDSQGFLRRQVYKISVTQAQWSDAAVTHDLTIATLPAKTRITEIIADITEQFACTATCTSSTLSMIVGVAAGDLDAYLDSFDVDAATAQFGLVDAERGAALQGIINGEMPSWSGTTAISARLTSGTGNLGDGATTNLSGGDVTFYITTEEMP